MKKILISVILLSSVLFTQDFLLHQNTYTANHEASWHGDFSFNFRNDGGYAIVGGSQLFFIDYDGEFISDHYWGGNLWSINKTSDNSYIVGQESAGRQNQLIHMNSQGSDIDWSINVSSMGLVYNVIELSNGNYIMAGGAQPGCCGGTWDAQTTSLNSSGGHLWDSVFCVECGSGNNGGDEMMFAAIDTGDGVIVVGYEGNSDVDGTIVKYSYSGELVWSQIHADPSDNTSYFDIEETGDGNYVITGRHEQNSTNIAVVKVDPSGNIIWEEIFDYGQFEYPGSIIVNPDNEYIVFGVVGESLNLGDQIIALKLNSDGDLISEQYIDLEESVSMGMESALISDEGKISIIYASNNQFYISEFLQSGVPGCTDQFACNFDSFATENDNSCDYSCNENGDYVLDFDGHYDGVMIGDHPEYDALTNEMSVEAWIYVDFSNSYDYGTMRPIISKKDRGQAEGNGNYQDAFTFGFYGYQGVDRIQFGINESSISSDEGSLPRNEWHHVAATFSSGQASIYIDGQLATSGEVDSEIIPNDEILQIGQDFSNNNWYRWGGRIDNPAIWNRSLSAEEIQNNFENGVDEGAEGLIGYWKFNEGQGSTVYDYSDSQHHGEFYNGFNNTPTWWEINYGCTDRLAENFDENADFNDGSCEYSGSKYWRMEFGDVTNVDHPRTSEMKILANNYHLESNDFTVTDYQFQYQNQSIGDPFPVGQPINCADDGVIFFPEDFINFEFENPITIDEFKFHSSGGNYDRGGYVHIYTSHNGVDWTELHVFDYHVYSCGWFDYEMPELTSGCMDQLACNYNPGAHADDGSCFSTEDYGWCDCDGNLPDQCGECGGNNNCLEGYDGGYLLFDGVDDYVDLHGNETFNFGTGNFTISHWFKSTEVATPGFPVSTLSKWPDTWHGNYFYGVTPYRPNLESYGTTYSDVPVAHFTWNTEPHPGQHLGYTEANLLDGEWHYISAIKTGTNLWIYIDGVPVSSQTAFPDPNQTADNDGSLILGSFQVAAPDFLNTDTPIPFMVSSVEIWDRNLPAEEIQYYMNNSALGSEGLVGYWDFENSTGYTLTDLTAFGNHGNIFGASWPEIRSNYLSIEDSLLIQKGQSVEIPILLNSFESLNGMIFSVHINSQDNSQVSSDILFSFSNEIDGDVISSQLDLGKASFVITFDDNQIGESIEIGSLSFVVPDDNTVINGDIYSISILNSSGSSPDYELVEMVDYQNIEMFVVTDPPLISLDLESICMVEGLDSYSSSFDITDDMGMNIDFTYTCPDYVELVYNSDVDTGVLNINPYDGASSGECILTAVTDDIIPESTQLTIPITINHIPDIGIGSDSFNVVEGQEYTFNLNPYDQDGDSFDISLVEGYPDYVVYNSNDNSITINAPLGSPSNELCFNVTDDGCAEIGVEECYDININHYPVISCDEEVIHIPEFDSRTIFCSFDDGGDGDLTEPVLTELSYVSTEIVDGGVLLHVTTSDDNQGGTLTITLADNTEDNLSDTDEISVVVYETYLSGDVRPQSDSDEAGGFGDGLIVAPDVVNILKVAVGLDDAPDSESDLFDAFDTYPSSEDINGDEDYFDEAERGGDQSIGSSDALVALNTAVSFFESIRMVDNDYPYSTSSENDQREDNRTNDLISLGVIDHEVARGELVSIPVTIQRGSVDGMSGFAAGFNLVSDNTELLCDIKFKPSDSEAPTFVVEGNPYGILVYDMNPIPAYTEDYQIGTIDFQVPWNETSTSITLEITSPSGNTNNLDVVHIDIENTSTVLTVNPNYIYQDENFHYGANLESFNALTDNTSLDYMFSSDGIIYNVIGEGVAASYNPALGWVGSLSNIDKTSAYWVKTNEDISYEMRGIPTYNNDTQDDSDDWSKDIHYGANLTAYPCLVPSNDIDSAIESESCFQEGDGIIGEGVAASYNPVLGWVGSLSNFEPGMGYWIKSDCSDNFTFQWGCEQPECIPIDDLSSRDITATYDRPEELSYVQSSQQAFYFIHELDLRESSIENGDWIVAYYDDQIVGARAWNGAYTDIPVMGFDNSDYSINYINTGELPVFKLYKDGEMIDLYGSYPEFNNLGIYHITLSDVDISIPEEFVLEAAYPNPFNPSTTIRFGVSEDSDINISVYDIQGKLVETLHEGFINKGYHVEVWNAAYYPSGVYMIRMDASNGFNATQKVVLIK